MAPPQTPVPGKTMLADTVRPENSSFWKTSTPASHSPELVAFKSDRVSAWLVQTPRLCSRAVQTDHAPQCMKERLSFSQSVKDSNTKTHCTNSEQYFWSKGLLKLVEVLKSPALLYILLALFVMLVIWPQSVFHANQCFHSNSMAHSFHLDLCYVNGPPPT
ncbi:uncharacterized protein Hap1MRO34_013940 isoform 2-T2 [Clarias gariepinus]